MFPKIGIIIIHTIVWLYGVNFSAYAQDIELPQPQKNGGMPLMEAINNRKSIRDFSNKEIPIQVLSDLLWAANGYNRPQEQMRTVPTAGNCQNMSVYVANADGLYLYDATNHSLKLILNEDIRAETGLQSFVKDVPVNLVYVADLSKLLSMMPGVSENIVEFYSSAHAGFIGQNVYLFCASFGLGAVVRGQINTDALKTTMKLEADQKIILMQSIGYPAETTQINMKYNDPDNYSLSQNYPNPFNPTTTIEYILPEQAHVRLDIFNINGEKVLSLVDSQQDAGFYTVKWDGRDDMGRSVSDGVFICRFYAGNYNRAIRMLLLK
jgi:SagB-type dehydrogenase family enzyme